MCSVQAGLALASFGVQEYQRNEQRSEQRRQVRIQREQRQYSQDVDKFNARQILLEAGDIRRKAETDITDLADVATRVQSAQGVQAAAAGVDVGTGTAADLQAETLAVAEASAVRIRGNAERQAQQRETQAALLRRDFDVEGAEGVEDFDLEAAETFLGQQAGETQGVNPKWYNARSRANQANTLAA